MNLVQAEKYPAYKPSGIEWFGDIPEDWGVCRLNRVVTCLDGKRIPLNAEQREPLKGKYPYWGANGIIDHLSQWIFDEPLVLLGEDGAPFFAPHKTVAFSISGKVWVNNHAHVLRPFGIDQGFLKHVLNITEYGNFIDGSTRDKLTQAKMNAIPVPLPPPEEQAAIVRFLDHTDEQIQRYIAGKERLIALLEEERQALVHQAVTRGLDPSVKLKASGVEWLGDVPEHWETARLGSIGRFSKGNGGTKEDEVPAGVPCIRYGDIYTSHKYFIEASRACIKPEKTSEYTPLRFGDILFAGSGETIEEIGKSAVNLIKEPAYSGGDVIIFRPTVRVNAEFTGYATDSPGSQAQKSIMGRGFTVMHIYGNQLKNLQIAVPPIGEQDGIVEHINQGTARIDDGIARSRRQINLMNEYRTRLIADVVTGQLDVRETAAQLQEAPSAAPSRTELRNE